MLIKTFYSPSYSNGNYSLVMTYKGNKDLTWETSYSFNTGVEFSVLNNRITGSVDFFSRKTVDLIYNKPVPPIFWYRNRFNSNQHR